MWEYLVLAMDGDAPRAVALTLQQHDEQGWEFVSFGAGRGYHSELLVVFRRPKLMQLLRSPIRVNRKTESPAHCEAAGTDDGRTAALRHAESRYYGCARGGSQG